ncbi:MAG: acyltransferase [bacterium]
MNDKIYWVDYRNKVKTGIFKLTFRKLCQLLGRFCFIRIVRIFLYRCMGLNIGKKVYIGLDCFIDADFSELITIEDRVMISFRVIISAHDRSREIVSPIVIKKRAFIGAGSIIFPGVIIGENSVVGAGSIVTRDVPDGAVVAGNPAKPINKKQL